MTTARILWLVALGALINELHAAWTTRRQQQHDAAMDAELAWICRESARQ